MRMTRLAVFRLFLYLSFIYAVFGLNNGLARTPPMGWLAWERFRCQIDCVKYKDNCISESLFMQMADHLVKDGFRDAGYVQINIDDCWLLPSRNATGHLVADPTRFPHGIKYLANYMHSRGLKLGIYEDFGVKTCMGYPGVIGHMQQDAETFAEWDIDMLKLDGCYSKPEDMDQGYPLMGKYLNQTGRPMIYSCSWPYYQIATQMQPNYKLIAENCNLWRVFDDIEDSWKSVQSIIDFFGDNQEVLTTYVGPGAWSDPDMLIIGNFHLTYNESRIQMALWSMLPAPLLMSNDLRKLDPKMRDILLNRRVIAIDQDPLGIPGKRVYKQNGIEVWKRFVTPFIGRGKSAALLFISRRPKGNPVYVTFKLSQFKLSNSAGYRLTELFDGKDYGVVSKDKPVKIELGATDCVMMKAEVLGKRWF